MENSTSERPERRTAIVSRKLRRYDIDIVETQQAGEGQLKEQGGGYTFFWRGKLEDERRLHGVGFAIKNEFTNKIYEFPIGISERLMILRLKLAGNQFGTVISAYAPTLDADDEAMEGFYTNLEKVFYGVPERDRLILLGDFNARVGRDSSLWNEIIGKEGVGKVNSNGIFLFTKCAEHGLTITSTLLRQKNEHKTSLQHQRSKHCHLIDLCHCPC